MPLPAASRRELAPGFAICRLLNGLWQVSGGHGRIDPAAALPAMFDYLDEGYTTWDLADHYGPAEDFIGEFRRQLRARRGEAALAQTQALTKWVPRPGPMTRQVVEGATNVSRRRMDALCLDMLQFHWWDYADPRYLDALGHLKDLQAAGRIKLLALTNFDTDHLARILEQGIPIVSNQVQYSIIDRRPQRKLAPFCADHNVQLLAYGALAGGLLSDKHLGQPEPRGPALSTYSLRKYKQMIDAWGGWPLFQELLQALRAIADKHGVSVANVATRYVLQQPAVAGVIVGARLGIAEHRADNARVFGFALDAADLERIDAVSARSNDLFALIGDCGDEYRG